MTVFRIAFKQVFCNFHKAIVKFNRIMKQIKIPVLNRLTTIPRIIIDHIVIFVFGAALVLPHFS